METNEDQQFNSGFSDDQPTPAPVEEVVQPKYVQITEDDFKSFQSNATSIAEMRAAYQKQFDTAFGKLGGVERTLTQLSSSGGRLEVSDDIVADMAEDFPELAALQLKTLKKFAETIKPAAPVNVDNQVHAQMIAWQTEALEDQYPTWRETVGAFGSNNAYRQWLSTQDPVYQQKLNSTNSADVIARSISMFNTSSKPTGRQAVIRNAITPKGDGGTITPSNADDDFNAGFAGR